MTKTNDTNYFYFNILNIRVFFRVVIAAYDILLIPAAVIVLPIVTFGLDGSILEKGLFILVIVTLFAIPNIIVCFIFHYRSLKTTEEKDYFYSLSPTERGKVIGEKMPGWF